MRPLLVRTLVFFALVALPTMLFDLVYWQAPLPWSLLSPSVVALRLTFACFVMASIERRWPRPWAPFAIFVATALAYAIGYAQGEYMNSLLHDRGTSPHAGLQGLLELTRRLRDKPRYFACLFTIVATPFAVASFTRIRKVPTGVATGVSTLVTFVVAIALLEPFRVEVGRITAAFVCVRTIFCGLMLPLVGAISDSYEARRLLQQPPE